MKKKVIILTFYFFNSNETSVRESDLRPRHLAGFLNFISEQKDKKDMVGTWQCSKPLEKIYFILGKQTRIHFYFKGFFCCIVSKTIINS